MNRSNSSPRSLSAGQLSAALGEIGGPARPDYLDDIVAQAGLTRQRPAWALPERWLSTDTALRRQGVLRTAVLSAALVLLALIAAAGVYIGSQLTRPSLRPPSIAPTTGGMWPQSTLVEVRAAQERADAGDPAYTWQIDPQLFQDSEQRLADPSQVPIVDRFLREVLGWDSYMVNDYGGAGVAGVEEVNYDKVYLRCDRGRTNPLYPGEPCAPTIDDLRYETVGIDLAQPDRRGIDGIWVVNRWGTTEPFAQADPELAQADVEATLAELAQARVDGEGAEGHIGTFNSLGVQVRAPLLYATTSGARYERFEIERAHGPGWPDAFMQYVIRLFADGGDTVVEQPILAYGADELVHSAAATTENGQPVPITYEFFDGQVSVTAALPWVGDDFDHWSALKRTEQDAGQIYVIRDPWPTGHGCFSDARTADAKALAETIASDPDLVASTPVAVTLAGRPAWGTEVTLAPGVSCELNQGSTRVLTYDPGQRVVWIDESSRIRLYLLDAPAGSSYGILAIAIKAPESRFESVVAEAMPILESIEFNLGGGLR